ncbi:N-acetylmuramoyl-L-alanine amidase [Metasolibacillus meyeri]|uniref:N-acetylmuramoyl-L-alanine amidase n=1 Tax=Metasolibacillus meyeri TaxID=1071052 RepID=A0AAW9NVH3_9BACL|nr:N-acetylmuramoyl-L-alanine amidase [Metasolibacillus meyeri]MEC1178555.1 N-acetylmuramoyl-L-alanine amidase [Metasolibacillus meyeri]
MILIRQNLVPQSLINKISYGTGNTKQFICVHETDNNNIGSDADAHSRLQKNGNNRQASWHWQVDDKEAVQSFSHDIRCWAAGNGNNSSIHVEICVNRDGNYNRAVNNAAILIAKIMKEEKIPLTRIVQHHYWTGKHCPRKIRDEKRWEQFINLVNKAFINNSSIQQPSSSNDKLHRLYTGTYASKEAMENAMDTLRHRFGWTCYADEINGRWRVKTGTFKGLSAAEVGGLKIKTAKIASVVHIKEA